MIRPARLFLPLVFAGLFAACGSSTKRSGNVYGTEEAFCKEWAKAACNSKVVSACAAASVDTCVSKQSSYCLGLVPPYYASKNAKGCIEKVKSAYSDAKLTAAEIAVVRDLGAPCDKLNQGPGKAGDTCSAPDECDSLANLTCIVKVGSSSGTCQVAKEVGGGFSCTAVDETCAVGFYCDGQNCIAKKGGGQTCTEEIPCLEDFQCLGATGDMKCVAKGDTAATCTEDAQCKSGMCAKPATGSGKCVDSVVLTPTDPICQTLG
ncbi:MAG: hypothetical protein U0263_22800 [Polyangiaceae bacterium]